MSREQEVAVAAAISHIVDATSRLTRVEANVVAAALMAGWMTDEERAALQDLAQGFYRLSSAGASKPRVLLVEDDLETAASMMGAFEVRGIAAVHAASVAEAKAAYEVDGFDFFVVDYELPDGTGIDFIATIRGVDEARVILYSGLDRSKEIAASGMDIEQMSKSDPWALLDAIEGES